MNVYDYQALKFLQMATFPRDSKVMMIETLMYSVT